MVECYGLEDVWANTNFDHKKWLRGDPETGGWFRYNEASGAYDIPLPFPLDSVTGLTEALSGKASVTHSHPTLEDINFTGTVSVGGSAGLTGSRLIPTVGTLTFTKGILTGFTPV